MSDSTAGKSQMNERELLARIQAGDLSACDECVEVHADGLYRLGLRLLSDPDDAEDVVQETFLNAFRSIDTFEGRASLATWLYRIAYNAAMMRLRKRRITQSLDEHAEDHITPMPERVVVWGKTPDELVEARETAQLLDQAITELPPSLRSVFHLREIGGNSRDP